MKRSIERVLTVIGAVVVLVLGLDAISYAATGKAFILGGTNTSTKTTVIKNTGSGAVLNLQTKSKATPPLAVNSTGVVKNLNSDYLDGLRASQLQQGALDPLTFTFDRTDAPTAAVSYGSQVSAPVIESNAGAHGLNYAVTGTITFPCNPATGSDASQEYDLYIGVLDKDTLVDAFFKSVPLDSCGKPYSLPQTKIAMTPTAQLLVEATGMSGTSLYFPSTLSVALTGKPLKADL